MDEEPREESAFAHLGAQELEEWVDMEEDEEEKKEAEIETQQFVIIQPTDNVIDQELSQLFN